MWATVKQATVVILAVGLAAGTAGAALVDSQGFENPPYSLGNLASQENWITAGGVPDGNAGSTAVVQNAVAHPDSGAQAVKIDRGANADARWYVPGAVTPTAPVVIAWDMRVVASLGPQTYGPFFGVEAYDYAGPELGVLGTMGVDAKTGDVLYQRADNGSLDETDVDVTFDVWNHFEMSLDFDADLYTLFLNDRFVLTESFVDSYGGNDLNEFTDADLAALAAGASPADQAAVGTAYFDNFTVMFDSPPICGDFVRDDQVEQSDLSLLLANWGATQRPPRWTGAWDGFVDQNELSCLLANWGHGTGATAVPEPGSLLLALIGALGIALRRRKNI